MDKRNAKIYSVLQPDDSRAVKFAASEKYPEAKGTLFKKRIINFGEYADQWFPDYFMHLDEAWGTSVLQNFADKTVGRVYVPSSHTDDPDKNRGEVIDMFKSDDGLGIDAIMDIRDPETVSKIEDDLIWDCSIGFTMNWVTKEGDEKGPAIYHVALVNNPYIEDMTPFEAFAKITEVCRAELAHSYNANAIMLSRTGIKKEFAMDKVKIINDKEYPIEVTYKEDDKDVTATIEAGAELEVPEDQKEAIETIIADSKAPEAEETDEEKIAREAQEAEDAATAAAEAAAEAAKSDEDKAKDAELARIKAENAEYRKQAVNNEYDSLLKEGKIVPAQENAFKALAEARDSNITFGTKGQETKKTVSELVTELFAHAPKVVKFSEDGGAGGDGGGKNQTPYDKLDEKAKAGLQATNVSAERYNENVAKHPEMYPENINGKKEDEE